jgi:hypothetical protein
MELRLIGWFAVASSAAWIIWVIWTTIPPFSLRAFFAKSLVQVATIVSSETVASTIASNQSTIPSWSPAWEERDIFTPRQAAFLWIGNDPTDDRIFEGMEEGAYLDMFREHARSGRLPVSDHNRRDLPIDLKIHRSVWEIYAKTFKGKSKSKFDFSQKKSGDQLTKHYGI